MKTNGLRPRAIGALSVVAASLFLLLCLANYGQGGFETAGEAPWHLGVAGWFVEVFGAGAFALVLLPLVWGLVVYFREDTPSLAMRAAGTVLLACSISMVSGLVQSAPELTWAGAVGEYTVALTAGLGGVMGDGLALALAWAATVTLFMASLVWATDWWFHSLRKGTFVHTPVTHIRLDVEPTTVELRDDEDQDDESTDRHFVTVPTPATRAADSLGTQPAVVTEPVAETEVPDGFSMRDEGDRVEVQAPWGYAGVEFLPSSDELASPAPPEQRFVTDVIHTEERVLDDEIPVTTDALGGEEPAIDLSEPVFVSSETEDDVAEEPTPVEPPLDATPIATIDDTLWTPIDDERATEQATDPAAERVVESTASEPPEADDEERPRSGIGIPDDSPFVDEFFSVEVLVNETIGGDDGASADGEIEAAFGTTIPSAPETVDEPIHEEAAATTEPTPAELERSEQERSELDRPELTHPELTHPELTHPELTHPEMGQRAEPVIVDELLFADAYDIIDDEIPAPIAARSAAAPPTTSEAAPDATHEGLDRIDGMQLDPLFHDAVDVVLEAGRGSAMTLQRRFGIGHGRGLRLLSQLEEAGILAAEDDAGTREVLIERATWEAFSGSRSA